MPATTTVDDPAAANCKQHLIDTLLSTPNAPSCDPRSGDRQPSVSRLIYEDSKPEPAIPYEGMDPQFNCRLLILPYELRFQIWKYVFLSKGDIVHIFFGGHGTREWELQHVMCAGQPGDEEADPWWNANPGYMVTRMDRLHWRCGQLTVPPSVQVSKVVEERRLSPFLPLMLTCRKIYIETLEVLLSSLVFSLLGPQAAEGFVSLASKDFRHSLKRLHVSWVVDLSVDPPASRRQRYQIPPGVSDEESSWQGFWKIVSTMDNLDEIRVELYDGYTLAKEDVLLEPLFGCKAKKFLVVLPWEKGGKHPGAPFDIERSDKGMGERKMIEESGASARV